MQIRITKNLCHDFLALIGAVALALPMTGAAANLIWNNGAASGSWNTTDANWTGSIWNNVTPDSALFNTVGGIINLSMPITAGSVTFSNTPFATTDFISTTLSNNSLQAGSLTVQGAGNNGSAYSGNPTLIIGNPVSIAGDVAVGRANLIIAGGTLAANRIVAAAGSYDWADVIITNATVWATNGVDGSVNAFTPATFQLDLNGGSLYTPYLKVADRESGGTAWFNWNGGTLVATIDTNNFIQVYQGSGATYGTNCYIGNGGAIINTYDGFAGHTITVGVNLKPAAASTGGFTKSGPGTLTLSGVNTYSGGTTINAGTLTIGGGGQLGGGNYAGAITDNGLLKYNSSVAQTLSGVISGNGSLIEVGSGTLTLTSSSNTFSGGTTVASGILAMGTDYCANENAGSLGLGNVSISGGAQIRFGGTSGYPVAYYYFPSANSFTFNNGQFSVTDGGQHIQGGVTVNGGGLTCYTRWIGKDLYLDGVVAGSGPITVDNYTQSGHQGYIHFSNASNSWSGTLTINAPSSSNGGAVSVDDNLALDAATVIDNNTGIISGYPAMIFSAGVTTPVFGALGGNGNIMLADGAGSAVALTVGGNNANSTYTGALSGSGSLTKNGTGTMTLSGTNTYLGDTFVNSGTLIISQPTINTNSTVVVASGAKLQLAFSGTNTVAGLMLNGVHLLPGIYNSNTSAPYITGSGSFLVSFSTSSIALNPAINYQQIHGIGANFCLGPQNISWNNSQFNLAFSPTNLNISFVRLANSFECWLDESNIFWSGWDSDNVRFIQMYRAIQTNGLITMASWSPPGRFKSTGSAMGGTLAKTNSVYRYADYADWWLRSLQYLRDNSTLSVTQAIPDFISIQNECDFTPSGTFTAAWQAGCYLSSTESSTKAGYPQALAAVKNSFLANGFGFVKFIGPDTTTGNSSTISSYLNNLPAGSLSAIAHHPYQGSVNDVGHVTSSLSGLRAAYPTNTIYMTEFFGDNSYGTNVPDWMMHCLPMHNIFTIEQANSYIMWGLSLSSTSGSFCALGHYSKFIRPNDWRAQAISSDTNILVSLYRHTNSNPAISDRLIVVIINKSSNYTYPTIQTTAGWATDPLQRSWQVYKTANDGATQQRLTLTENLAGASLSGDRTLVLAPYSITTAIINTGVYTNAPPVFTSTATNRIINPGQTLLMTNTATDANQSAQNIKFALPVAPAGATLNATNGILNWRPLIAQANTTNPFSVVASDNATPSLSATQNFTITVRPVTLPVATSQGMSNGVFRFNINGVTGPDYTVVASTNLLIWTNLFTTNPATLPFTWADTNLSKFPRRFYRVSLGP